MDTFKIGNMRDQLLQKINFTTSLTQFYCPSWLTILTICLSIFPLYSLSPRQTTTSKSLSKSGRWMLVSRNRIPLSISSVVIPNWCLMLSDRLLTTPESATSLQVVKTLFSFSYCVIINKYRLVNLCKSISVWTPLISYASEWANAFCAVAELISIPPR